MTFRRTILGFALILACSGIGWLLSSHTVYGNTALQVGDLVKGSGSSVYYYGPDQKRYVFPTAATYFTWYTDFSSVKTISDSQLSSLAIGGNVTYRPGVKLVKVTTDPKVYAIAKGGALRHVSSESLARALFGSNWMTQVQDIPDAFFTNYMLGTAIDTANDYVPSSVQAASPTIAIDKGLITTTVPVASTIDLTKLPLGDQKKSSSPQRGYIYLCNVPAGRGGAQADGPWIHGTTWDLTSKLKIRGAVQWTSAVFSAIAQGVSRIISGNGLPSHTTGVYPVQASDPAYQYDRNPNSIQSQSVQLSLLANPTVASSPNCVGGEVGIALSGVPIFNGFDAGNNDAVAHEVQDECNGHPQVSGVYHYHGPSSCVNSSPTNTSGEANVFGYALDGFGIYENVENGKSLTNEDLDECHGHTHEIVWNGERKSIYHYHLTNEFPYTLGCFRGTPVQRQVIPMR